MKKDDDKTLKQVFDMFDDLFTNAYGATLPKITTNSLEEEESKKDHQGKLLWKKKETLSRDSKTDEFGRITTHVWYRIPIEINTGSLLYTSRILTAIEKLLDSKYTNFIYVSNIHFDDERCTAVKFCAVFDEMGPLSTSKKKK